MKTILVYGLKNVVGGIENYLMMMLKHLHNDFHFVFLIECFGGSSIYEQTILDNNGTIEYLPERHKFTSFKHSLEKLLDTYKSKSHTLYVNVGHISFDIIPIKIALKKDYRVITHSHNAMQEPISSFQYRIRQFILRSIGMLRLKYLPIERLAVSNEAGRYLYRGKPYKIVASGIAVETFTFDEVVRQKIRTQLKCDDCVVLGFVGRLVSVKNPLFLIDVLHILKIKEYKIKLVIIGDGVLKDAILTKAANLSVSNDIVFTGFVDNVQEYLQSVDVLLAPSFSEGLGLSIIEAQSMGIPCICAKDNIPKETNVTGNVKFVPLNPEEWSNAITNTLSCSYDRNYMHQSVQQSDYNITNAAKKLLDILK